MINRYWKTATYVDEICSKKRIKYSIIKSYHDISFVDGNIDVVVEGDLMDFYKKYLYKDFSITKKDLIKFKFYERNKLMCVNSGSDFIPIHLHSNAGWHDLEFFSGERILNNSSRIDLEEVSICLCSRPLEQDILFYHSLFEKHQFSVRDMEFLGHETLQSKLLELTGDSLPHINVIADSRLPLNVLFIFWRKYYYGNENVRLKNLFFHIMLVFKQRLTC